MNDEPSDGGDGFKSAEAPPSVADVALADVGRGAAGEPAASPPMTFGIVLADLQHYGAFVHLCFAAPLVTQSELTYGAPIYKGNARIKAGVERAANALEKFDVYFREAILNEEARVQFARAFATGYMRRFPRSERQDLFFASSEVLKFMVELASPASLRDPSAALSAIAKTPHDPQVLETLHTGQPIARAHLRCSFRLFLDHVFNPRRRDVDGVKRAAHELGTAEPYVVEMETDGAVPGYLYYCIAPFVRQVGGRLVLLPG